MADLYEFARQNVQKESADELDSIRAITFCLLLWAESRQRNVTRPSAKEMFRYRALSRLPLCIVNSAIQGVGFPASELIVSVRKQIRYLLTCYCCGCMIGSEYGRYL
jgi:hypothetical protein